MKTRKPSVVISAERNSAFCLCDCSIAPAASRSRDHAAIHYIYIYLLVSYFCRVGICGRELDFELRQPRNRGLDYIVEVSNV